MNPVPERVVRFRKLFSSYLDEAIRRNDHNEVAFLDAFRRYLTEDQLNPEALREARTAFRQVAGVHNS